MSIIDRPKEPKGPKGESKFNSSEILNYNLNKDVELLMYSYLPLEEILTIFRDDIHIRDKIIRLYFKELPDINDASVIGHLETVKYLYDKGDEPTILAIDVSCNNGYLEVIKFLYEKGIQPTSNAIDWASENGHLDVVKYLYQNGIQPTDYAIEFATINGHLEMVKYLQSMTI